MSHRPRNAFRYIRYLSGIRVPGNGTWVELQKRRSSVFPVSPVSLSVPVRVFRGVGRESMSRCVMYRRSTGDIPESVLTYRIRLVRGLVEYPLISKVFQDQTTVCIDISPKGSTHGHIRGSPVPHPYRRYRKYRTAHSVTKIPAQGAP